MKKEIKINGIIQYEKKIEKRGFFTQANYITIIDLEDGSQDIILVKKIEYFKDYKADAILEYYKHKKDAILEYYKHKKGAK